MSKTEPFTDPELIAAIADRGAQLYLKLGYVSTGKIKQTAASIRLEVTYVHSHICPLRLQQLLDADEVNFAHDIGGIHRHLDIVGSKLKDCFLPRFAA